jgi:predicted ATP-grasp superfamily ATP-dependent carboligase
MSTSRREVLLIASIDSVGVTRLPGIFSGAGFRVVLLASDRLAVSNSRFVAERIGCARGAEATVRATQDHLARNGGRYHSVVIADEPALNSALATDSRDWLQGWFPVPLSHPYPERIRSKVAFLKDSREAGIPVPRFEVCADVAQLRSAAEHIGYPLFVKSSHGFAGSGLFYARTPAELEAQLAKANFDEPVLVQEEMSGDTGSIPVLYDHGKPVCWFSYLMKISWPTRFSSACAVEISAVPEAENLVVQVGRLTQFNGLCGLDFMRDPVTGRVALLEFNPRPLPTCYLGPYAGVNFSRALAAVGSAGCKAQKPDRAGKAIDLFPQALYRALDHTEPVRFFRAFADAPWSDPLLTAAHLRRLATHQIPEPVRKLLKRS